MKLSKLSMKYFGPFEKEVVDFHSLNDRLFLISGRTGSGKTMIFDAIVTALYGSASTTGRDEESLRSQFAPDDAPCEVSLKFEVKDRAYTVERVLKYQKPGNKSATPPKAVLYDDQGRIIASSLTDLRDAIEDIVKLTKAQFRKILILPQGEFKELLVSTSQEKQDILRTLFQTERFLDFENNLRDELKERSSAAAHLDTRISELIKYINTEEIDIDEVTEFPNYDMVVDYVDGVIYSYDKKLEELRTLGTKRKEEADELSRRLQEKIKHNEQIDRLNNYKRQLTTLVEQSDFIEKNRQTVKRFDETSKIKYELLRKKELETAISENKEALNEAVSVQANITDTLNTKTEALESIERERPEINDREKVYYKHERFLTDTYRNLNDVIERLTKDVQARIEEIKIHQEKISKKNDVIEQISYKEADLFEARSLLTDNGHKLEAIENKVSQAEKSEALVKERQDIETKLSDNNKEIEERKNELASFSAKLENYDEDTLSVINHLVSHLEVGLTCPVCEQTVIELPEHGEFTQQHKEEFNALSERLKVIEKENQSFVNRLDVIEELLNSSEYHDSSVFKEERDKLSADKEKLINQVETIEEKLKEKEALSQEVAGLKEEEDQLTKSLSQKEADLKNEQNKKAEFTEVTGFEDYESFKNHMDSEYETLNAFQKNYSEVKDEVNQLSSSLKLAKSKIESYEQEKVKYQIEQDKLSTTINNFLTSSDFNEEEELYDLVHNPNIEDKRREVKQFDEQKMTLQAYIKEVESVLTSKDSINIEGDQAALKEADDSLSRAREFYTEVRTKRQQNEDIKVKLSDLINEHRQSYEFYMKLVELTEAIQGKKGQKVSLERYVLIYYLDRILDIANIRLLKMTNHRYKLQRSTKRTNRYSGLDIEVFDYYNNQERNINTLSGGETFQASLVLALALNEALQQESGGIQLDTMLIDEGFGTLDQETLEVAITTLIDLQTSGKTIGIISHVEELKDRMENILTVSPENGKSTVSITSI